MILNNNHWNIASYKQRVTREELRTILLESQDTIIRFGNLCEMKKKHLGAGIYEIWFERKPFDGPECGH